MRGSGERRISPGDYLPNHRQIAVLEPIEVLDTLSGTNTAVFVPDLAR